MFSLISVENAAYFATNMSNANKPYINNLLLLFLSFIFSLACEDSRAIVEQLFKDRQGRLFLYKSNLIIHQCQTFYKCTVDTFHIFRVLIINIIRSPTSSTIINAAKV